MLHVGDAQPHTLYNTEFEKPHYQLEKIDRCLTKLYSMREHLNIGPYIRSNLIEIFVRNSKSLTFEALKLIKMSSPSSDKLSRCATEIPIKRHHSGESFRSTKKLKLDSLTENKENTKSSPESDSTVSISKVSLSSRSRSSSKLEDPVNPIDKPYVEDDDATTESVSSSASENVVSIQQLQQNKKKLLEEVVRLQRLSIALGNEIAGRRLRQEECSRRLNLIHDKIEDIEGGKPDTAPVSSSLSDNDSDSSEPREKCNTELLEDTVRLQSQIMDLLSDIDNRRSRQCQLIQQIDDLDREIRKLDKKIERQIENDQEQEKTISKNILKDKNA